MSGPDEPGLYEGALATAEECNLPGLVVDPGDRSIRAVNGTFERAFGWSNDELHGVDYREIVEPDDHEPVRSLLSVLSFGGSPSTERIQLVDADGDARETKWVGVPNLGDDRGEAVTVFCRPTSWREGDLPEALEALHDQGPEEWLGRTLDVDDEREGSHSSSLWD